MGLTLSSCAIAIGFQKVNSYFGLLGGTAGVMMAGGIPAMCYWKLMKMDREKYVLIGFIGVITVLAMAGAVMSVVSPVWKISDQFIYCTFSLLIVYDN